MKHVIDAKDKKLGRIASEAAIILMGKNRTDFAKNTVPEVTVEVTNASKIFIDPKKIRTTPLRHHSGFPGGLRTKTTKQYIDMKGYKELVRKTVHGMLPTNKLRARMIKNLIVTE